MTKHVPVSELIHKLIPDIADPPVAQQTQAQLDRFWRSEAGVFATECHPILFQSGRLAILCESPVWATQLRNLVPSLTRQLTEAGFKIRSIDVKTSPDPGIPRQNRSCYKRAKGISEPVSKALDAQSRNVSHPGLSDALKRLSKKTERNDIDT